MLYLKVKKCIYALVITCSLLIVSCDSKKDNEDQVMKDAKWAVYYMNYQKVAKPSCSGTDLPKELKVIQCDVAPRMEKNANGDTMKIFFRFYYKDTASTYILSPPDGEYMFGVGIVNGKVAYPINSVGVFEFMNYPDSVKLYMSEQENGFVQYLKNYPNPPEINDWMKKEMKVRVQ